jgi:hypothetical protein
MGRAKQQQTVELDRGLFLIRYATADDEVAPPTVTVVPDLDSEKNIDFVLHPDHKEADLWQPGTCLVVRATAPGRLIVEVLPVQQNGSAAATIKIEALTQGRAVLDLVNSSQASDLPLDFGSLRVLGHIASIGDVVVSAGEWLAGPSAPSRIEGISIEWPSKPEDLDIRYSVKAPRPYSGTNRLMTSGSFVGTRGKALPIVSLTLEMSGAGAINCQFNVEAIFLGSPAMRTVGRRIVLSGATGREPLVGLRVALEDFRLGARAEPKSSPRPDRAASGVRVFRSRPKLDQSPSF